MAPAPPARSRHRRSALGCRRAACCTNACRRWRKSARPCRASISRAASCRRTSTMSGRCACGQCGACPDPDERRRAWPSAASTRPFIFASLGTLQGDRYALFKRIAKACRQLDAQLLIAHCGGLMTRRCARSKPPAATRVCAFAPQQAVLARADAVVSHAGAEHRHGRDCRRARRSWRCPSPSTSRAWPRASRTPALACALRRAEPARRELTRELRRLLDEPDFAAALAPLSDAIRVAGGAPRAADIDRNRAAPADGGGQPWTERSSCMTRQPRLRPDPGRRRPGQRPDRLAPAHRAPGAAHPAARAGDAHLGGNHTWSFHDSDLTAAQRAGSRRWSRTAGRGYDVVFPEHARTLERRLRQHRVATILRA